MNLIKSIKSLYLSPVKFLLQTFLFGLLYTSILRFVFYLYFLEQSGDSNFRDIAKSFLTGIRFDTVVVLTLLLPVILFFLLASVIFQIKLKRNFEKYSLITYLTTIFSLFTIFHLSDISFFANFDSRLNYLAYEYVGEGNMVMDMIILQPQYYVVIASWIILTLLFYRFFKNRHRVIEQDKLSDRKDVLIYFMILIFSLAGIRGTFGIAPLDWGTAYISQNHFINQMTLNPIYTLTRSIQEDNFDPRLSYLRENERFRFVNFSEALKTTQDMLSARNETLLDSLNSIYRTKFQPRAKFSFEPNIVLIIMESFSARNIGALGSAKQLTPYFDSLAADGILFNNFYSASNRSNYGLGALLCSFPAMPGRAILKRYNAMHPFLSFSEILKRRNYYNGFLYGGDISFDNMQGFFRQKGYDKFWGDDNFDDSLNFSKWGIPDHILFDQAGLIIDSLPRPFQLTIFTLSNHEPFDLPDSSLMKHFDNLDSSKEFNGMIYSDHALGKFMKEVKKDSVFDSTIFIITADHGFYERGRYNLDPEILRIPLLIYAPMLIGDESRLINTYGGQVDFIPTIMGILGGDYSHASWGRDLLNLDKNDNGYAIINVFRRIGILNDELYYYEALGHTGKVKTSYDLTQNRTVKENAPMDSRAIDLQNMLYRYMQTAEQLSTPVVEN